MNFCSKCGNEVTEGSKFCASCGTVISSSEAASVEVGVPASSEVLIPDAAPPPPPAPTMVGSASPPPPPPAFVASSASPPPPPPAFVASSASPPPPPPAFVASSAPPVARYCNGCGAGLVATAVTCPTCGTRVHGREGSGPKSKTTAVLLACFLSFWTWLYTYKKNTWKFWVGLVLGVVGIVAYGIPAIAVWIWAIIDVSIKPSSYYEEYDA